MQSKFEQVVGDSGKREVACEHRETRHASRFNGGRDVRISARRIRRERQIASQLARRIVRRGMRRNESHQVSRVCVANLYLTRKLLLGSGVPDVQDTFHSSDTE